MSKDGWNDLPTDILRIIFSYLEKKVMVSTFPMKFMNIPSQSLLQCQLTCKNWSSLAEAKFYSSIVLKSPRQLNLMIGLDYYTKNLVHSLLIQYTPMDIDEDSIITSFRKIAFCFTEIQTIHSCYEYKEEVWKVIKSERSSGRFNKLQAIPFLLNPEDNDIVQYNNIAWDLRNNLRELEVYDVNPVPDQNIERLSHFLRLDKVYFKLRDFNHFYTMDQQLKKSGSVRLVDIVCVDFTDNIYSTPVKMRSNLDVLANVKQLDVKRFLYDCNIYSYVMQVFQNLVSTSLNTRSIHQAEVVPSLSTKSAIQFLKYLLRIPTFYVTYIPFENIELVLMEFYEPKRIIKTLDLHYVHCNGPIPKHAHVFVWTYIKHEMSMEVKYAEGSEKCILPRIGLIEENGDNLEYIKMNMGFDITSMDILDDQEDHLSRILNKCPNLKTLHIGRVLLRTFGTDLQEKKIEFFKEMELHEVMVYGSFLYDMSFHLPLIDKFKVNNCRFDGGRKNNVTISMPYTSFITISYDDHVNVDTLYLKLFTIADNRMQCFIGEKGKYQPCSKNKYENSLQDDDCLSIFIQCKQVDNISFGIFGLDLTIKNILK